ncbi:general odorant-binding protein 72-like [Vespula squamosa]|uniref:General odorant-binding protein 72-like n=1 Tax=Vespula squamosa TaxID=30214 RepID=A0ABD2AF51_VESSQ
MARLWVEKDEDADEEGGVWSSFSARQMLLLCVGVPLEIQGFDISKSHVAMTIEQMQKTATGIRNTCITKTGVNAAVDDSYLLNVELVNGMKTGQYPEDHNLQCYAQCVMKTIRTFKNQKVDVDMVTKQIEMMMPMEWQEGMKAAARKCGALELLDNASQKGEFPPDPKLQCYFKCVLVLSKAMKNDQLRPEVMKTQAELMLTDDLSERIKVTIDKCAPSITSSDSCEAAWQFAKCYYETDSSGMTLAKADYGFQKYIHGMSPNVLETCIKESKLEADKDKLLTDETSVDPEKFSCFIACTLKNNGALANGEIQFNVLSELLKKLLPEKEDKVSERLEIIKSCLPEGTGSNDCERIGNIVKCVQIKLKEKGI